MKVFAGLMMGLCLLVLAIATVSAPSPAAAAETSGPPQGCEDMMTTQDMVECAAWGHQQADLRLNQLYKLRMDEADEAGKALLRTAQRAWIAFRDAECERDADEARGGTLSRVLHISCLESMTVERVRALNQANSLEGPFPEPGFERSDGVLVADLRCDGEPALVTLDLVPKPLDSDAQSEVLVRLTIDREEMIVQINSAVQNAVCGAGVSMSVVPDSLGMSCMAIRIDDFMCDAIHVLWDKDRSAFTWWRN